MKILRKKFSTVFKIFRKVEEQRVYNFEEKEDLSVFEILPDEIVLEIFRFLPVRDVCLSISLVNSRFARLYRLGVHTIQVRGNLRKLPEDNLIKVLLKFEKLEKLIICNEGKLDDYHITNSGLIQLAHKYIYHSADYVPLNLNYHFQDFGYEKMLDNLSTTFESGSCMSGGSDIDDNFFIQFSETNSTISDGTIKSILSFNSAKNKALRKRQKLREKGLLSEIDFMKGLEENTVEENDSDSDCESEGEGESEEKKEEPSYGLSTLKQLDLTGCNLLTDFGVKYLTFICRDIQNLSLRGCTKLTDNAIEYFREFDNLKSLNLGGITTVTDKSLKLLSEKSLQKLDLTFCRKITDKGLEYLSKVTSLEELSLQCCISITSKGLGFLFSRCKELRKLNLTGCSKIMLSEISEYTKIELPKLEYLSLLGCTQTTDQCLGVIVAGMKCKHLKKFKVAYCDKITDEGIKKIVKYCRNNLIKLNLKRCTGLTHFSIKSIANFCSRSLKCLNVTGIDFNSLAFYYIRKMRNLEKVVMQNCRRVTDQTLKQLSNLKSLRVVDLSFNEHFTYSGLKFFCSKYHPAVSLLSRKFGSGREDKHSPMNEVKIIRCPLSHRQRKDLEKNFPRIIFKFL